MRSHRLLTVALSRIWELYTVRQTANSCTLLYTGTVCAHTDYQQLRLAVYGYFTRSHILPIVALSCIQQLYGLTQTAITCTQLYTGTLCAHTYCQQWRLAAYGNFTRSHRLPIVALCCIQELYAFTQTTNSCDQLYTGTLCAHRDCQQLRLAVYGNFTRSHRLPVVALSCRQELYELTDTANSCTQLSSGTLCAHTHCQQLHVAVYRNFMSSHRLPLLAL